MPQSRPINQAYRQGPRRSPLPSLPPREPSSLFRFLLVSCRDLREVGPKHPQLKTRILPTDRWLNRLQELSYRCRTIRSSYFPCLSPQFARDTRVAGNLPRPCLNSRLLVLRTPEAP